MEDQEIICVVCLIQFKKGDVKVIFVKTSIVTVMDMSFVIIKYCLSLIRNLLALGTGVSYDMPFDLSFVLII